MRTTVVSFDRDDVEALTRALQTLDAEQDTSERWGFHSVELEDTIRRVGEIRDRMVAERGDLRASLSRHERFPFVGIVQGGRS